MNKEITAYNAAQNKNSKAICAKLEQEIRKALPKAESKVWHRSPVWFLDGNPITGYSVRKNDVQLLFWSGQSFEETGLLKTGSFKAAEARYTDVDQIISKDLQRWLKKAKLIQWDYKNIIKRRGMLVRISTDKKTSN